MLTEKQQKVLDEITEYIAKYWKSPTIEELQHLLNQKSKRWVVQYLESLEKKGFITRWRGYRSIRLWNWVWFQTTLNIPILGYANAWKPLVDAKESDFGVLPISKKIVKWDVQKYFILKVEWTSMNNVKIKWKKIENWAYVLVDSSDKNLNSKDVFVFSVNGGATIKRYKRNWNEIYLLPDSTEEYHKPIILSSNDEIIIHWKIVDVFNF
jgi:SOS-response transcriptional repressor LexA